MTRFFVSISLLGCLALSGCQGTGQLVNLKVYDLAPSPDESHGTLSVAIQDFEDNRQQKGDIGLRTHLWGGTTRFTVWDGKLGSGIADATAEYLEKSGWKIQKVGLTGTSSANVVLTGKIRQFSANAKSGFGFTKLSANIIIDYHFTNSVDGSVERVTIGSGGNDTVFIFEPEDLEKLVYDTIEENLDKLLDDTEVKGKKIQRRL